ncbi:hypothetical protein F5884DRAFT_325558 [Xylogone sp. PMI_703]|nr:hypothetical protein F5884DRAFT_325558 [Xylogone sp. PMI_703]
MAIINQVMVEVLNVAERGLELHPRQVPTTVAPSASATTVTPTPSPTKTNSGGGGGPTSSPLLFFVALGFGVVFTNLWIIVGVKYCFRYNARNRALRAAEDGEPINMDNIPTRPHRRRREKKLMTMDEVNERFPLMKYKAWVASRAREGLPTSGGIAAGPGSRPATLRNAEGIIMPSSPVDTKHSIEDRPATAASDRDSAEIKEAPRHDSEHYAEKGASSQIEETAQLEQVDTTATALHKQTTTASEEDDDDEDHIHTAVPPELLSTPGDSCAICIDTLEDDEDIRGLACGHAFHAACIDPWLTSRRACCPLCKADYYIPKPRPEGEAAETERTGRRERRMNMPQPPPSSWSGLRAAPRLMIPVRFSPAANYGNDLGGQNTPRGASGRARREARETAAPAAGQTANTPAPAAAEPGSEETATTRRWRFGNPLGRIHLGRSRPVETTEEATTQPSPSQLEAGVVR